MTPQPERLNITLYDITHNVTNATDLRHKIARYSLLNHKQIQIEAETVETLTGRTCEVYKITSTKKVPFVRWEVCQAFIDGINGV